MRNHFCGWFFFLRYGYLFILLLLLLLIRLICKISGTGTLSYTVSVKNRLIINALNLKFRNKKKKMRVADFNSTNIATHLNELGNYFGKSSAGIIIWRILVACQLFHCFLPALLTLHQSHKSCLQDTVKYCQQLQVGCSRQTSRIWSGSWITKLAKCSQLALNFQR